MDKDQIVLLDSESIHLLKDIPDNCFVIVSVPKEEIDTQATGSLVARLLPLCDTDELVLKLRETLIFKFDGFDSDPRELYEVPEVRKFLRAVVDDFPQLLWFMARSVPNGFCLPFLFYSLCDGKVVRRPPLVGYQFADTNVVAAELRGMAKRMSLLLITCGLEEYFNASVESAVRSLVPN